jgi:outer membrane protein assembly factor BamE (lipoprotein component of BamABCDE complex)
MTKRNPRALSLVIPSGFVIRHSLSNFTSMKNILRSRLLVLFFAAVFALNACHGQRLTRANVDEVAKGMSRKQVESILGLPTSVDSTDLLITKKVTYIYRQGNESVTIVFFNDEVASKESNLHE